MKNEISQKIFKALKIKDTWIKADIKIDSNLNKIIFNQIKLCKP